MSAPEWRKQILAGVKQFLRERGFRGSHTKFYRDIGNRKLSIQLVGGSDPHDTGKLCMWVSIGIDFLDLGDVEKSPLAYTALWWSRLSWTTTLGNLEYEWRAYSNEEAQEVLEGIITALPPMIEKIEERFQTWHDALPYLDRNSRDKLDPLGRASEWKMPKI